MASRWALAVVAIAALAAIAFAACDGDDAGDAPTPTVAETEATGSTPTREPTPVAGAQLGEDPIFYTPLDAGFASLRAGEPYKILFRITNGYDAEVLPVTATNEAGETIEAEALYAEPVGEGDPPGSYYPFSLEVPEAGTWTVTVTAGADSASFTVEAGEPEDAGSLDDIDYVP